MPDRLDLEKNQSSEALPKPLPLSHLNILLIDDCEDNQFLFKRVLQRKGAKVTLAGDGREGLDILKTNFFDLVLLDIQMPVMDGLEMMQELKAQKFQTPVVALTGFNRACEKTDILAAGFASIVSKPIDADLLIDTILESIRIHEKGNETKVQ